MPRHRTSILDEHAGHSFGSHTTTLDALPTTSPIPRHCRVLRRPSTRPRPSMSVAVFTAARRNVIAATGLTLAACAGIDSASDLTNSDLTAPTTVQSAAAAASVAPTSTTTAVPSTTTTNAPVVALAGNYTVEVITSLPHDEQAYTQGLEWHEGWLYESTGHYNASDRRRIDPTTGEVDLVVALDDKYFGEGLTIVGDEVLQLTWREGVLIRSSLSDLEAHSTQSYDGAGWGLCHDGEQLLMSDGSSTLTRRDSSTFETLGRVEVTSNGQPITHLNELECVDGQVLANVYGLDQIVAIDPTTGIVVAVVDASALRPEGLSPDDNDVVLNGIAYQPETGHWFLTGKFWPVLYEVDFVPAG